MGNMKCSVHNKGRFDSGILVIYMITIQGINFEIRYEYFIHDGIHSLNIKSSETNSFTIFSFTTQKIRYMIAKVNEFVSTPKAVRSGGLFRKEYYMQNHVMQLREKLPQIFEQMYNELYREIGL